MKNLMILLPFLFLWGCGGDGGSGDSPQAPVVSGGSLSISWNMSQSSTIEENSDGATLVDATLNNSTVKLSYSLSGTDSSNFSISNGYLVFNTLPDYENPSDSNTDNSYALTITASGGGISSTHSFTVNVTNINEAPALITDSSVYFQVNENSTLVVDLEASDPEGDVVSYSLKNSSGTEDESLLNIDTSSGTVSFKNAPNFESPVDIDSDNNISFTIEVSDGSVSSTKKYYATVIDVKENPTDISLALNSVEENVLGANFGLISLVDDDPVGITDISLSGADSHYFEVGQGFSLKFKSNISSDYENKSSYTLTITATDKDAVTLSKSITLNIIDVNESPSIVNLASSVAVLENQTSAVIVTATDQEGDTLTYSLTGSDASFLAISSSGVITFNAAPNYESKTSYAVSVNVSDGTNTTTQALTINVTDVNEAPTDISLTKDWVNENLYGAVFGTLSVSDPDTSDTLSFSLSGNDSSLFELGSGNVLKFKDNRVGDYESQSLFYLTITATDSASNTYSEVIPVALKDINEHPSFTDFGGTNVAENASGYIWFSANDQEGMPITYSIVSGGDSSLFSLSTSTLSNGMLVGYLTFNRNPDYEIPTDSDFNNIYEVSVKVSDGESVAILNLAITVVDVNEPDSLSVPENVQTVETQE